MPIRRLLRSLALVILLAPAAAGAQVPAPGDVFGFEPGADYELARYQEMVAYYRQLDAASDRVVLREIGTSVLGRPLLLLFISSEENIRELERWRSTSERLARARVDDAEARRLSREGRAVVWIDGGLHATERAGAQMTPLLAYRVATEDTPEMRRIRDEVVLLLMPVMNPDGLDIVASWYDRVRGTPHETTSPPWLYHHYVGHDNNRDWFMNNMPESRAVSRVLYGEWYPQIVYNHHQTAPAWTRIFIPPFRDPVNPRIHPGVTTGVNLVGSAMANRFAFEGRPGVISDVVYSMWWNGGMRTVPYYHNMVGILTETAHATPTPRYYAPDSLPSRVAGLATDGTEVFYPDPWKGGTSRFRDAVEYMLTASLAVLDVAADRPDDWLYGIYRMGRDAIRAGRESAPYAFVVPADQWDSGEAAALVDVLLLGGVEVHRADAPFAAGDTTYAAGAYVVPAAQSFRPYVLDLLERQAYPDRRAYAGGPVEVPYDLAGWTLPLQMGVRVDRLDSTFSAETVPVRAPVGVPPGTLADVGRYGFLLSPRSNAVARAVNYLLAEGETVYRADAAFTTDDGTSWPAGTVVVPRGAGTARRLEELARTLGLDVAAADRAPERAALARLERPRVGLYKSWVANMDEGWTRWLLTQYAFAVDTLHDADVRGGALARYDAVILPDQSAEGILHGYREGTMPEAYTGGLGLEGALALQRYVEDGGTLVAFDGAADFAIEQFGLPVRNVVAGTARTDFFVPGSLLRLDVDAGHPLAFGMPEEAVAAFARGRAFTRRAPRRVGEGGLEETPPTPLPPVEVVARYAETDLLLSGWATGETEHLGGEAALVRVPLGVGDVVLFGFRPQFRGQPRGTYKFVFNALFEAARDRSPVRPDASEE